MVMSAFFLFLFLFFWGLTDHLIFVSINDVLLVAFCHSPHDFPCHHFSNIWRHCLRPDAIHLHCVGYRQNGQSFHQSEHISLAHFIGNAEEWYNEEVSELGKNEGQEVFGVTSSYSCLYPKRLYTLQIRMKLSVSKGKQRYICWRLTLPTFAAMFSQWENFNHRLLAYPLARCWSCSWLSAYRTLFIHRLKPWYITWTPSQER